MTACATVLLIHCHCCLVFELAHGTARTITFKLACFFSVLVLTGLLSIRRRCVYYIYNTHPCFTHPCLKRDMFIYVALSPCDLKVLWEVRTVWTAYWCVGSYFRGCIVMCWIMLPWCSFSTVKGRQFVLNAPRERDAIVYIYINATVAEHYTVHPVYCKSSTSSG